MFVKGTGNVVVIIESESRVVIGVPFTVWVSDLGLQECGGRCTESSSD